MLRLVPIPALYDQQIKLLMEKLYSQIIQFLILVQQSPQNPELRLQENYCCVLELLFKTFLHQFDNQFLFEHFNNFVIRILAERDIKYYQLKAQICAHLARLICCDESPYTLDPVKDQDYDYVFSTYRCIDYSTKFNCGDKEQGQYFQYLQRILMPPGYFFQLLFVNYDA